MPRISIPDWTKILTPTPCDRTVPLASSTTDIVDFARHRLHFDPDENQAQILRSTATRGILNCSRQWGKSTVIAALAVHRAFTRPNSEIIVASPSARQSAEFMKHARSMLQALHVHSKKDEYNRISAVLPNGSRLIGLPHVPETTRGFSALSMLIIDEAAYVSDEMYNALTPMLATTNGNLWLMSTPNGKSGFFYETWQLGEGDWHRLSVTAPECPRISPEFLAQQVTAMGRDIFGREFLCEFLGSGACAFDRELVEAALESSVQAFTRQSLALAPSYLSSPQQETYVIGVDLGKKNDYSTFAIVEPYLDQLHLHSVERIPLGTPYTKVVETIRDIVQSPKLRGRCSLVVDSSGVGEAVVDMLRRADLGCAMMPLVITGGREILGAGHSHVAKHNLMTRLQLLLEQGELKIARGMRESGALVKELLSIRIYENGSIAAPAPQHDDLVMALALACWKAKLRPNTWGSGGALL